MFGLQESALHPGMRGPLKEEPLGVSAAASAASAANHLHHAARSWMQGPMSIEHVGWVDFDCMRLEKRQNIEL